MNARLPLVALALAASACHTETVTPRTQVANPAGLYDDLGSFHRPVTTKSDYAQRYFDQGLTFCWAFNHDEAIRSFREAARLDPQCAMPWWGIALANGPHINNPTMDPEHSKAAWEALAKARELAPGATGIERELIDALSARYGAEPPADRGPLDRAYAEAMRKVWSAHPKDADVAALCAEALMDLHPWDLWTTDGQPKDDTLEIVATLEKGLALVPEHAGLNHLYIHAIEASPQPEKALASADRLRTLVPGAGHLVHMPAHIDVRVGQYAKASEANVRAIAADEKHRALFPRAGFYRIYMLHNRHFLAFSSMMEGKSAAALAAAHDMLAEVPPEFIQQMAPLVDGYLPIVFHVLVRFGRWEDVLKEPAFAPELTCANSIRHYARGTALCALGRLDEADGEARALDELVSKIEAERPMGNNPAHQVLAIAQKELGGEIAFRRGRVDEALELLRTAAHDEDALKYDEPPDWMMPVRHALGATLLAAGKAEEAEQAYREDLKRFPENGWSLVGLAGALEARGRTDEARQVRERFTRAWKNADVELGSSCFCQPAR